MLNVNVILREAYYSALKTIIYNGISVPVFWEQLPTTIAAGIYITFGKIRNVDKSDKISSKTETSVTVSIFTNNLKYNDGVAIESVANEVLNRIYKTPNFKLDLGSSFYQIYQTRLLSDMTNNFSQERQNVYIDRIIVFQHSIYQNIS